MCNLFICTNIPTNLLHNFEHFLIFYLCRFNIKPFSWPPHSGSYYLSLFRISNGSFQVFNSTMCSYFRNRRIRSSCRSAYFSCILSCAQPLECTPLKMEFLRHYIGKNVNINWICIFVFLLT